jgi:probable F420-dependent oxidoreductase
MRFAVDLGRCNPGRWPEVARAADELGYESVWLPEHLIFPAEIQGSPAPDDPHVQVRSDIPLYDPFVMLASLATATDRVRVGTNVYNIGLRHPFVTARAVATLDIVSNGRVDLGIGASWLREEWDAVGLDFASRGDRVDECLTICRRLWTEPTVAFAGAHFAFDAVRFEPKPVQARVPVHVGGDSRRALRRAVEHGDGWIAMVQPLDTFARSVEVLRNLATAAGRSLDALQRTALEARPDRELVAAWQAAGATRLVVAPWARSADAVEGLRRFRDEHGFDAASQGHA